MRSFAPFLIALVCGTCGAMPFQATPSFEGYLTGGGSRSSSTALNPGNQIAGLADWTAGVDLRPQLDVSLGDSWRAIFRPRYLGSYSGVTVNGVAGHSTFSRLQVDEAYLRWEINDQINATAGLLNFQWGPAELLGPSNPLVHFQADQRSLLFRQRGKALIRLVYSFSVNTTAVLLVEPISNGEDSWIAQQPFTPRALLKLEKRLANPANYIGLTGGREDQGQAFLGQYFNYSLTDSLSLYGDARETWGSAAYYPVVTSGTPIVMTQTHLDDHGPYALATVGARYEGDVDARVEYIFNSYGLAPPDFSAMLTGLFQSPDNLIRTLEPGRELTGRHYLYVSLRTDKLGHGDSLRVGLRYLLSLQDGSGSLVASAEWALTDNLTALLQPVIYHGSPSSEFAQGAQWEVLAGARVAF